MRVIPTAARRRVERSTAGADSVLRSVDSTDGGGGAVAEADLGVGIGGHVGGVAVGREDVVAVRVEVLR